MYRGRFSEQKRFNSIIDGRLGSRPRWTSHPCSSTTLPLRWEQTRPIGNGTVRLSGIGRGTSKKVHTFVSVGPYRLKYLGTGNNAVRVRRCRTGKTSPANNIRRSAEWSCLG